MSVLPRPTPIRRKKSFQRRPSPLGPSGIGPRLAFLENDHINAAQPVHREDHRERRKAKVSLRKPGHRQ
jgi:hypothetical protein